VAAVSPMERLSSVDMECVKAARFYHAPDISLASANPRSNQSIGPANPWPCFDGLKLRRDAVTPLVTKVQVQARREVT